MSRIAKTRQVQLLHVLSRKTDSYRNSDGDWRTSENVVSSWMPPVTVTRLVDRDTVIILVCADPGYKHEKQDILVKSITHVATIRLRWKVAAIISFAAMGAPIFSPLMLVMSVCTLICTVGALGYQGISLITPREGLGHDLKNEKGLKLGAGDRSL